jgi:hypothetical protein
MPNGHPAAPKPDDYIHPVNDTSCAVTHGVPDSACGSMVLADLLCGFSALRAEKPQTFEIKVPLNDVPALIINH